MAEMSYNGMDNEIKQHKINRTPVTDHDEDSVSPSDENCGSSCSKTNIIVNYLPQTMTQDDLKTLFSSVGTLESCKLIRDKNTGQSLGYGFVNYKNADNARLAIDTFNGLRLQTKIIKVSLARPSNDNIKGANLYVSGLSKTMSQTEVDEMFCPYGVIVTSRLLCDSQTGLSKGVGFVRYETRSEAEQAIRNLNGTIPSGSTDPVTVKFANCPVPATAVGKILPLSCNANVPSISNRNHHPNIIAAAAAQYRYAPVDASGMFSTSGCSMANNCSGSGWCIFIYNLAPETEENVLWQLFGPFGAVQNVKVVRDLATQKCKGFGFVTMTNYPEAVAAVANLDGYPLGSRILQVSFKQSKKGSVVNSNSRVVSGLTGISKRYS